MAPIVPYEHRELVGTLNVLGDIGQKGINV